MYYLVVKRDQRMSQYVFTTPDGRHLACTLWDRVARPIGVVQIIHGMAEDINRYDRFAKFLNSNGYIVFGDDHRTHGRTTSNPDIFSAIVSDEIRILKYLKRKYKLPVFLFGHGYGSFITQQLLSQTNMCTAGVCMAATARYPRAMLWVPLVIAWIGMRIWGSNARARFLEFWSPLHGIIFDDDKIKHATSEQKRRMSENVPHKCFSYGFYYSLLKHLMNADYSICPQTPLLIISGGRDIVGLNGRLARSLYNAYGMHDLQNLTLIIYPNAHHELLHDLDWVTVQEDILDFFNTVNNRAI